MTRDKVYRLGLIVVLQLVGILAGVQLGKIAPLVEWYQSEIGFSLVLIGWFTSMIGIFVAAAALPAGWVIERAGPANTFLAGSVVMTIGGIALALLVSPAAILASRLVEGAGYLVLVIATPALLAAISPDRWKPPVLAIWGGFVPIGFALADFTAQAMLSSAGPQSYLLLAIAAFAILATIAAILLRAPGLVGPELVGSAAATAAEGSFAATMTLPVALVALAFGIYVVLSVGFFTFMPAYVDAPGSSIALSAGAIALFVPIGNVLASLLVSGRDARFIALLSATGFAVNAALAIPAFDASSSTVATSALALFAIAGGMTASALFASIPFIVRRGGSASVAIGLVAQAGGIGTLFGPPLAGYVIETYGFAGFGWFLVAVALVGIVCLMPLIVARVPRDGPPQTPR
jgi:MFS family permease